MSSDARIEGLSVTIGHERASLAWPSRLVVETTSRCNLSCAMCAKQSRGMDDPEGDLSETIFETLEPAFPRLDSLVLNGIGEPLLHPRLEHFIHSARAAMPASGTIGFQTNGSLMGSARAESIVGAGCDRVCVSLDALDEELYAGIRSGGSLATTMKAIEALDRARSVTGRRDFRVGIEFVARRDNLDQLPRLVRWAAGRGVNFVIVSQLFPYEKSAVDFTAYDPSLDLAVGLRKKYEEKGRTFGVDLLRYPEVYLKYAKGDEDRSIIRLVEEMQAEAASNGITMNIDRLLRLDTSIADRARRAFEEAGAIAKDEGMEIALPEARPRSARACEFVEGGSAFVSFDGGVHPCYFLWHRYACYVGGWEKFVAARSFGNLSTRGILEVWNDPAFIVFRSNVLRYEYPFCLNCNLALCDFVQLEDFTQDCHINQEPCASCLWCMGLFRCMY
jgi:putative metalloenzyme radical SAM/SPASM domain maturase